MNEIRCICQEHGEQKIKSFIFAGVLLRCGCSWRMLYERGLVYQPHMLQVPAPQILEPFAGTQMRLFGDEQEKRSMR